MTIEFIINSKNNIKGCDRDLSNLNVISFERVY